MKKCVLILLAMVAMNGCASADRIEDPTIGSWNYYGDSDAEYTSGVVYLDTSDTATTPQDEENRYFATSGFIEDVAFVAKCLERDDDDNCESTSIAMMGMDGQLLNAFGEFNYPQLFISQDYPAAILYVDAQNVRAAFPLWESRGNLSIKKSVFFQNRMIVEQNGLYGYVDHTGQAIIAPRFLAASNFNEDKAIVITDSGMGTIDLFGQFYPDKYACITPYDEQFRSVNLGGKLINYTLDTRVQASLYVSQSLKRAQEQRPDADQVCIEGKWGLIDAQDNVIVPPEYDFITTEEGTSYIHVQNHETGMSGVYDFSGNLVVKPEYKQVVLGDHFFVAQNAEGKFAIMDKKGNLTTEFVYENWVAKTRQDNMGNYILSEVAVVLKDGLWGAVLPNGTVTVEPTYEELTAESEGLIGFRKGNRWGVIDTQNKEMHSPIYGKVGLFEDGRTTAELAGDEIFIYRDDNARNAWLEKARINEERANQADRAAAEEARQQQVALEQQRLEEERKQTQILQDAEITRLLKERQDIDNRIEVLEPQYQLTKSEGMRQDLEKLRSERAQIDANIQKLQTK